MMNHYDDRVSYFALLIESGKLIEAQDNNNQQDISISAYGFVSRINSSEYFKTVV